MAGYTWLSSGQHLVHFFSFPFLEFVCCDKTVSQGSARYPWLFIFSLSVLDFSFSFSFSHDRQPFDHVYCPSFRDLPLFSLLYPFLFFFFFLTFEANYSFMSKDLLSFIIIDWVDHWSPDLLYVLTIFYQNLLAWFCPLTCLLFPFSLSRVHYCRELIIFLFPWQCFCFSHTLILPVAFMDGRNKHACLFISFHCHCLCCLSKFWASCLVLSLISFFPFLSVFLFFFPFLEDWIDQPCTVQYSK